MRRFNFILTLLFFGVRSVLAQTEIYSKESSRTSVTTPTGFVSTSASRTKSSSNGPVAPSTSSRPSRALSSSLNAGRSSAAEDAVLVQWEDLSPEVRNRMNRNKQLGRPRFEGVATRYDVRVNGLRTSTDMSQRLSAVRQLKGFVDMRWLRAEQIQVLVHPTTRSEQLKEVLSATGLSFDLQKEEFIPYP